MSKSDLIREALAQADEPMSVEDITAAIGSDESEARATAALLAYLQKIGEARNDDARRNSPGMWVKANATRSAPPPKSAARAKAKPAAIVAAAPAMASPITPPGSTALADDGSILLLEGDRVVARLSQLQALNIAALVARHTAPR